MGSDRGSDVAFRAVSPAVVCVECGLPADCFEGVDCVNGVTFAECVGSVDCIGLDDLPQAAVTVTASNEVRTRE